MSKVKTPCIGRCTCTLGDDTCKGCGRTANQVRDWNGYSHSEKEGIMSDLKYRDALHKLIDAEKDLREEEVSYSLGCEPSRHLGGFGWYNLMKTLGVMDGNGRIKSIFDIIEMAREEYQGQERADFLDCIAYGLSDVEKVLK